MMKSYEVESFENIECRTTFEIIKCFETKRRKSHKNQRCIRFIIIVYNMNLLRNDDIVRFTIAFSVGHMCDNAFFQYIFIVSIA